MAKVSAWSFSASGEIIFWAASTEVARITAFFPSMRRERDCMRSLRRSVPVKVTWKPASSTSGKGCTSKSGAKKAKSSSQRKISFWSGTIMTALSQVFRRAAAASAFWEPEIPVIMRGFPLFISAEPISFSFILSASMGPVVLSREKDALLSVNAAFTPDKEAPFLCSFMGISPFLLHQASPGLHIHSAPVYGHEWFHFHS